MASQAQFNAVPKYKWLLTVYAQDNLSRKDFMKSSITSTFGRILKMGSTKKIAESLLEGVLVQPLGPGSDFFCGQWIDEEVF